VLPRLSFLLALTACGRLHFDDVTRDASGDGRVGDRDIVLDGPGTDCHVNHSTAIFCDGFEDGMTPWTYTTITFGTAGATTTRAWGGTHALEAHSDNSANIKYARWGKILASPITTGEIYVRQYMWLPSSVTIDGQASLLVTGNGQSPFPSTFFMLEPSMLTISTDVAPYNFPDTLPRDRWVCMEMQIHIDPSAGFVRVTFDGGSAIQTPLTDTDVAGGYTNVDAGIHYANEVQSPGSLWIDDIVLDTSPIGCN
jgi:hypothetical protein